MHLITARVALAVGVTCGIIGSALAATDGSRMSVPATALSYTIAPADMMKSEADGIYYKILGTLKAGANAQDYSCFVAGLHLPQDAKMIRLYVIYSSGVNADPTVYLDRQQLSGAFADQSIVENVIPDNDGTQKIVSYKIPGSFTSVNNTAYSYTFTFCLGLDDSFGGARVVYTPPA